VLFIYFSGENNWRRGHLQNGARHGDGHALNAYGQENRTLKVLNQSEKGINALLAANGITQVATGRDLFGKR
jgi:hypothetical protein